MSPLSFENWWTYRNEDRRVNTVDENITTAKNLVNFGAVTPEILRLLCMSGESTYAKMRCALVFKGHSLGGSSIASL